MVYTYSENDSAKFSVPRGINCLIKLPFQSFNEHSQDKPTKAELKKLT